MAKVEVEKENRMTKKLIELRMACWTNSYIYKVACVIVRKVFVVLGGL